MATMDELLAELDSSLNVLGAANGLIRSSTSKSAKAAIEDLLGDYDEFLDGYGDGDESATQIGVESSHEFEAQDTSDLALDEETAVSEISENQRTAQLEEEKIQVLDQPHQQPQQQPQEQEQEQEPQEEQQQQQQQQQGAGAEEAARLLKATGGVKARMAALGLNPDEAMAKPQKDLKQEDSVVSEEAPVVLQEEVAQIQFDQVESAPVSFPPRVSSYFLEENETPEPFADDSVESEKVVEGEVEVEEVTIEDTFVAQVTQEPIIEQEQIEDQLYAEEPMTSSNSQEPVEFVESTAIEDAERTVVIEQVEEVPTHEAVVEETFVDAQESVTVTPVPTPHPPPSVRASVQYQSIVPERAPKPLPVVPTEISLAEATVVESVPEPAGEAIIIEASIAEPIVEAAVLEPIVEGAVPQPIVEENGQEPAVTAAKEPIVETVVTEAIIEAESSVETSIPETIAEAAAVVESVSAQAPQAAIPEEPVAATITEPVAESSPEPIFLDDRTRSMSGQSFSSSNNRNSILDSDIQVQIIRMRGQVERTRMLVNEQLRLRNMPALQPGQYTLPPVNPATQRVQDAATTPSTNGKRNSIISVISSAVVNAISNVASPTTPGAPLQPQQPQPTISQDEELRRMREELERTKREIAEQALLLQQQQQKQQPLKHQPYVPAPPPTLSTTSRVTTDDDIEYRKPGSKAADTASISSGKSGKSSHSTSAGWSLFRSKSKSDMKDEKPANQSAEKPRKKSIKSDRPLFMTAPGMSMGGVGGRF